MGVQESRAAKLEALQGVFWDMDGTLIDSEPLWHESELRLVREYGGHWTKQMAMDGSGRPVPQIAQEMAELGCPLPPEEIGRRMIQYVTDEEKKRLPWIPGVRRLLEQLRDAGVPSMLVTTSPRELAENLIAQAPPNTFAGYVCGDDDVPKKPDPAPYELAAQRLGIPDVLLPCCVAFEDSMSGRTSAATSGMTTVVVTGYLAGGYVPGPGYTTTENYDDITPQSLNRMVQRMYDRLAPLAGQRG